MGLFFVSSKQLQAQNRFAQNGIDSAAIANRVQQEFKTRDSIQNAIRLKRSADSLMRAQEKIRLQNYRDSIANARNQKRIQDSIARIQARDRAIRERQMRDSTDLANRKKMADSLENVRNAVEKQRADQKRYADSVAGARRNFTDSILTARRRIADSLKEFRLAASEKRKALQAYKNSKGYKDSVANVKLAKKEQLLDERTRKADSIRTARKLYQDSVNTARRKVTDSIAAARKQANELIANERKKVTDSLMAIRKKIKDSIASKREQIAKTAKDSVAKKKKDLGLKLNMAEKLHEKKKEDYSSAKFLKKKWSLKRKIYQNTVTRYNYYYNAKRKYDDATRNLIKNNKDDYSKNIHLFPFDVEKVGSTVAGDMDTVIKKSSFSTQIHDPRSKWFDNLFFLMAKASFVKNDFDGAIQTLQFIINEYKDDKKTVKSSPSKKKEAKIEEVSLATVDKRGGLKKLRHHPIRNEALVLLARTYILAEQYSEAAAIISTLEKDKNFPKRNKTELYLTKAYLSLIQQDSEEAIAALENAFKQKSKGLQRHRMEFVIGQLYASQKDYKNSNIHFKKAIAKQNSDEMNFFAKLNIAQNAALSGEDTRSAKNQLDKIINNPKFVKYKSQALNVLAKIVAEEKPNDAIAYLQKSINNKENTDTKQKALAYAALGDIYFKLEEYKPAKSSYDSSIHYGENPPIDNIEAVVVKKQALIEIVQHINTISELDSIIDLSKKSEKEQRVIAKKRLDELAKQAEANEPKKNNTTVTQLQPNNNKQKSNWYFYNSNLVSDGSNEFKQKWGSRKLEDNWRRQSAAGFGGSTAGSNDAGGGKEASEQQTVNGQSVSSLLSKLPKTPSDYDKLDEQIMTAYYKLGLAYYSQLENYNKSISAYDSLLARFPKTDFRKQTYYGLYLDYLRLKQDVNTNKYKQLLQQEFPNSEFAMLANNPNYADEKRKSLKLISDHYDSTYSQYLRKNYAEAQASISYASISFKTNPFQAKYELVNAMILAAKKESMQAKTALEKIVKDYPSTEEQSFAESILNYLNLQMPKDSSLLPLIDSLASVNDLKSAQGSNNKIEDSLIASIAFKPLREAEGKAVYVENLNEEHYVIVFVKNFDGRGMALKAGLSDFNMLKYDVENYKTDLNLFTEKQGLVSVKQFSNAVFAKKYSNAMQNAKSLLAPFKKNEYEVALISKANYTELLKTRDILGYLQFFKKNYK